MSRTINDLNTTDTLAGDDKLVIWKDQAGATRAITAADAADYFSLSGGPYQPLDELLTAIAGQGPNTANGDFIQLTGQDTVRVRKLTVATYAALTVIPASFRFDDMLVYVASRATDGDGGEGWWRFDTASSATANGGTILAPDAGTGRWIRLTTSISVLFFGTDRTALLAADALGGTITIPSGTTCTFASNTTLTAHYDIKKGGLLAPATSVTLTLSGTISAGDYQIFSGAGTIAGNPTNNEFPLAWFGAFPTSVANVDVSSNIQKAIDFAEQGPKRIIGAHGNYRCDTGLVIDAPIAFAGQGPEPRIGVGTILDFSNASAGATGVRVNTTNAQMNGLELSNLNIYRQTTVTKGSGGAGLDMRAVSGFLVQNVVIGGFDRCLETDSINTAGTNVGQGTFDSVTANRAATEAVRLRSVVDVLFVSCRFGSATGADRHMLMTATATTSGINNNAIQFQSCVFVDATYQPAELIRIEGGYWINFHQCVFEQSTTFGVIVNYSADQDPSLLNLSLDDCWFDVCGRAIFNAGGRINIHVEESRFDLQNNAASDGALFYDTSSSGTITQDIVFKNNVVKIQGASGVGAFITKVRGARVTGNTFYCTGAGAAVATIVTGATADQTHLIDNHSVTTNADTNGFSNGGTNSVIANNTKATT